MWYEIKNKTNKRKEKEKIMQTPKIIDSPKNPKKILLKNKTI